MTRFLTLLMLVTLSLTLAGCGGGKDSKDKPAKDAKDHKDHKHEKDDKDHKDHKHEKDKHDDDDEHGEKKVLGKADIAGYSVEAAIYGDVKDGEEAHLDIAISGGTGEPQAVRAWIGVESNDGSTKAKLDKEGKVYHGHVDVPKPRPAGSALWVEVQDAKGEKKSAKFELK